MVKRQHKIMCLVLCLMLAVSTVFVGVVSASAATGDTVYVRVNNGWSKVNCYMWTDGLGSNASWPGQRYVSFVIFMIENTLKLSA